MECGACARIGTNASGSLAHSPNCNANGRYIRPAPGDVVQGEGWERAVLRDGVQIGTVGMESAYRGMLDFYSTDGRRSIPVGCQSYVVPTTAELIAAEQADKERRLAEEERVRRERYESEVFKGKLSRSPMLSPAD